MGVKIGLCASVEFCSDNAACGLDGRGGECKGRRERFRGGGVCRACVNSVRSGGDGPGVCGEEEEDEDEVLAGDRNGVSGCERRDEEAGRQ